MVYFLCECVWWKSWRSTSSNFQVSIPCVNYSNNDVHCTFRTYSSNNCSFVLFDLYHPHFSFPPAPGIHLFILWFYKIRFVLFLGSTYKWYHTVLCCIFFFHFWLISLSIIPSRFIHVITATATAKSLQSCPTLWDPIDGSPPGSPVPGILQARTVEWVAISFSNAWKWKVKVKSLSRVWPSATPWTVAFQAPPSMGFSIQEYWSGVPLPSPHVITNVKIAFFFMVE